MFSAPPRHLDVSRCERHHRIELWVNHVPYALTHHQAGALGMALMKAASGSRDGSPLPAGDLEDSSDE
jgi:hypothetical protein